MSGKANSNRQTEEDRMTIESFAAELRSLKPGHWFVGRIPVRVSTVAIRRGGGQPDCPQRVYTIHGRDFYVALQAAAWAID